eukprot:625255-Pyramimonas_sp.AAC.1
MTACATWSRGRPSPSGARPTGRKWPSSRLRRCRGGQRGPARAERKSTDGGRSISARAPAAWGAPTEAGYRI